MCVSTVEPQLDSEVVDGMAIRSTSVQRPANVDGLGYHMIDSDPDQMGSSAKASVDVDDVTCVGPTDAGFQAINEAPAQPLSSASPRSASSSRCRSPELSLGVCSFIEAHTSTLFEAQQPNHAADLHPTPLPHVCYPTRVTSALGGMNPQAILSCTNTLYNAMPH